MTGRHGQRSEHYEPWGGRPRGGKDKGIAMTADTVVTRLRPPAPAAGVRAHRPRLALRSFGLTDRGQVRDTNEDCFAIAELARTLTVRQASPPHAPSTHGCHRGHVLVVADGVGGNQAGEVASRLVVQTVEDFLLNTLRRFTDLRADDEQVAIRDLRAALARADARLFEEADAHPGWHGMGTTLTLAFVADGRAFVAHAGDSRCYLYSDRHLHQVTRDHTLTADMVEAGMLPRADLPAHPLRNVVTNLLGGHTPGVRAEVHRLELLPDDILLLCSDGLTDMVSEDAITAALEDEADPQAACEWLVAEANRGGGKDNITVVVARVSAAD
ncbi:MAG: protein phosphatase 2C domain-containing protein [Gemmataceae bacterium]|nr:protein phosphatase 2C domain-containing protein [Gemmataceae bacterium]